MTKEEKLVSLLGSVNSAIKQLEWYARDYHSSEIKSIVKDLKESYEFYQSNRRKK